MRDLETLLLGAKVRANVGYRVLLDTLTSAHFCRRKHKAHTRNGLKITPPLMCQNLTLHVTSIVSFHSLESLRVSVGIMMSCMPQTFRIDSHEKA